jgi:Zn-dependent protease
MTMDGLDLRERLLGVIVLVLSLTVHEWAHAFSARLLGDDTAEREGRLTLNPIAHIDPIGTLLLPMMGVLFGWARPVPVNPTRFRRDVNMQTGMMITAAAGPFSNVVLAFLAVLIYGLLLKFNAPFLSAQPAVRALLSSTMGANVGLAVFNMLPIPPLDGSRVVDGLMPYRHRNTWESFTRMAPLVLLAVILMPRFVGYSVIEVPATYLSEAIQRTVGWLVGA